MVNKEEAIALRLQGNTHQQIAQTLDCSVAWCKANLKGIRKPSASNALVEEVRRLGRSCNGVTSGEIRYLVRQHYTNLTIKQLNQKVDDIKRAAKKGHKDVIIRPYWLLPDKPQQTINSVMDAAQSIYERINIAALDIIHEYGLDESYYKSLVYQITALSAGENNNLLPQGILNFGDYLASVSDVLNERNKG